MKFSVATAVSSLLLTSISTFAQRTYIGYPPAGATVVAGSDLTVEIARPDFQSSATEVAVVIAMNSCPNGNCFPPSEILGPVLYNGPYNPQFHPGVFDPHQNFTVTVPNFIGTGKVQLNVFHVSLIGASNEPFTEYHNITLNLQD